MIQHDRARLRGHVQFYCDENTYTWNAHAHYTCTEMALLKTLVY